MKAVFFTNAWFFLILRLPLFVRGFPGGPGLRISIFFTLFLFIYCLSRERIVVVLMGHKEKTIIKEKDTHSHNMH